MRCWYLVCCALGIAAHAARADAPAETLSARDIQTALAPYAADVRTCYATHVPDTAGAGSGALRLELTVEPAGRIARLKVSAPGVAEPAVGNLDRCLRRRVAAWRLPARAGFTTAIVPFLFHRAAAPGAGPVMSCQNPRGCPPSARTGT
jgi:hypothetical protein